MTRISSAGVVKHPPYIWSRRAGKGYVRDSHVLPLWCLVRPVKPRHCRIRVALLIAGLNDRPTHPCARPPAWGEEQLSRMKKGRRGNANDDWVCDPTSNMFVGEQAGIGDEW